MAVDEPVFLKKRVRGRHRGAIQIQLLGKFPGCRKPLSGGEGSTQNGFPDVPVQLPVEWQFRFRIQLDGP
jgi:hypothetical protein